MFNEIEKLDQDFGHGYESRVVREMKENCRETAGIPQQTVQVKPQTDNPFDNHSQEKSNGLAKTFPSNQSAPSKETLAYGPRSTFLFGLPACLWSLFVSAPTGTYAGHESLGRDDWEWRKTIERTEYGLHPNHSPRYFWSEKKEGEGNLKRAEGKVERQP